jgi:hypothetical protein
VFGDTELRDEPTHRSAFLDLDLDALAPVFGIGLQMTVQLHPYTHDSSSIRTSIRTMLNGGA